MTHSLCVQTLQIEHFTKFIPFLPSRKPQMSHFPAIFGSFTLDGSDNIDFFWVKMGENEKMAKMGENE
jgi:hypothetical protein